MDVIIRDEAFAKPVFFKGSSFLFDKFAVFLKNNHHIVRINNQLHLYKDGIYVSGQQEIESAMIKHIPQLNRAKRTEVMSYLDIMIRENTKPAPANLIAFRNGIFDVLQEKFFQFSPEYIITNKIDWDYNPNAYYQLTDEVLNNLACDDKEIRALLEELIFRGLFLGLVLKKVNNIYVRLIVSALIFAVPHIANTDNISTIIMFIFPLLYGIVSAEMFVFSKSVWMSTGFHWLWNYSITSVFMKTGNLDLIYIWIIVEMIILIPLLYCALKKIGLDYNTEKE